MTSTAASAPGQETLPEFDGNFLAGLLGVKFIRVERGAAEATLAIRSQLMAPNGFLHAGTVVALADTACGVGCMSSLPDGAESFTTVELKSNFIGTTLEGSLRVHAKAAHLGRTTQIWDAEVVHDETGKTIALFRCTQMVLWPKGGMSPCNP